MYYAVKFAKWHRQTALSSWFIMSQAAIDMAEGGLYKDLTDGPTYRMLRDDLPMKRSGLIALLLLLAGCAQKKDYRSRRIPAGHSPSGAGGLSAIKVLVITIPPMNFDVSWRP
jgi:hypothetical protein